MVGAGAEPFAEKGTEGGETAGGDTEAAFDVGPEGDFNGCVWVEVSKRACVGVCFGGEVGAGVQRKSQSAKVCTQGIRMMVAEEALLEVR